MNVSYFGKSITHPGVKAGTNWLSYSFKPHIRKNGDTTIRQAVVPLNIGFYLHFRNHYGLFLNSGTGYRVTYQKGFFWQLDIEAGYLRTFLAGPVYTVDQHDNIHQVVLAGSNQFMPVFGIMLGKDLHRQNRTLKSYFGRLGGFLQYPFNTMWMPNLTLEFGASFDLQ